MSDADVVALWQRRRLFGLADADHAVEHALDNAPVDGADHRMLDNRITERTVFGDDLEFGSVASSGVFGDLFGAGGKTMSRQGIGDGVERTLEGSMSLARFESLGHCGPVFDADLLGHLFGHLRRQHLEGSAE